MRAKGRVLFLTYQFPPWVNSGAYRSAAFARHLPAFGWEPVVVTTAGDPNMRRDETLLEGLEGARVYRTKPSALPRSVLKRRAARWAFRACFLPDYEAGWLPLLRRQVDALLRKEAFDLVYTSCPPYSLNSEGIRVKRRFGLPWVTDFRDKWTMDAGYRAIGPLHRWWERGQEERVNRLCDARICNTDGDLRLARQQWPWLEAKTTWIPNGYDAADMERARLLPAPAPELSGAGAAWRLVYTGICSDFYSPQRVLEAVRAFLQRHPQRGPLELHYAGPDGALYKAIARRHGLDSLIVDHGQLGHAQALALAMSADLLLLFLPAHERARSWVPAKLYGYLASRKPIFGVLPDGDASSMIKQSGLGISVPPGEAASRGAEALASLWEQWRGRRQSLAPDAAFIQQFERRALTGRLAELFEAVCSGRTFPDQPSPRAAGRLGRVP